MSGILAMIGRERRVPPSKLWVSSTAFSDNSTFFQEFPNMGLGAEYATRRLFAFVGFRGDTTGGKVESVTLNGFYMTPVHITGNNALYNGGLFYIDRPIDTTATVQVNTTYGSKNCTCAILVGSTTDAILAAHGQVTSLDTYAVNPSYLSTPRAQPLDLYIAGFHIATGTGTMDADGGDGPAETFLSSYGGSQTDMAIGYSPTNWGESPKGRLTFNTDSANVFISWMLGGPA